MKNQKLKYFAEQNASALLAAVGCIVLWILMGVFSNGIRLISLIDNAYTASFLAIAGIGQMLVVTTGRGAIDLSIPGMITLGAFTRMGICNGSNAMIIPALLVVICEGIVVGFLNSMMVIKLKMPAIIATMAMNYIIITVTMLINKHFNVFSTPSILKALVTYRIGNTVPIIIMIVILLAILFNYLIKSTPYGKGLQAMGQNLAAARLAGVKVVRIEVLTYILAASLAGLAGALISARVTGAYLGMGDSYQMDSIACIVIGGTLMSGGRANTFGTLIGSLFLYLIISCIQLMGANAGIQSVVKGALIVIVLLIGAADRKVRSQKKYQKVVNQAG